MWGARRVHVLLPGNVLKLPALQFQRYFVARQVLSFLFTISYWPLCSAGTTVHRRRVFLWPFPVSVLSFMRSPNETFLTYFSFYCISSFVHFFTVTYFNPFFTSFRRSTAKYLYPLFSILVPSRTMGNKNVVWALVLSSHSSHNTNHNDHQSRQHSSFESLPTTSTVALVSAICSPQLSAPPSVLSPAQLLKTILSNSQHQQPSSTWSCCLPLT